jgi:hypothetical protein
MNFKIVAAMAMLLLLVSCAPRFTVYVGLTDRINMDGVTLLSVDTLKVSGYRQKRVEYAITRDIKGLERAFLARKIKRMKKEVDNLSR